jgi:hypothetical protein
MEIIPADVFLKYQYEKVHNYKELSSHAGTVASRFIFNYFQNVELCDREKLKFMRVRN